MSVIVRQERVDGNKEVCLAQASSFADSKNGKSAEHGGQHWTRYASTPPRNQYGHRREPPNCISHTHRIPPRALASIQHASLHENQHAFASYSTSRRHHRRHTLPDTPAWTPSTRHYIRTFRFSVYGSVLTARKLRRANAWSGDGIACGRFCMQGGGWLCSRRAGWEAMAFSCC